MGTIKSFHDLAVWKNGMRLTTEVYKITALMPRTEIYGLSSQMRRAAASIPMNIAEGFGQHTRPKFIHGLRTAVGSLYELMTAYEIGVSLEYLIRSPSVLKMMREEDLSLTSLIRKLEAKGDGLVTGRRRSPT